MKDKPFFKSLPKHGGFTLLSALFFWLSSHLFLRYFYVFLQFDAQFYAIFRQIKHERMSSPILLLLLLSFGYVLLLGRLRHWRGLLRPLGAVLALLVCVAILLSTVFFTKVNGVLFFDVVRSLIPLLKGGAI